MSEYLPSGKIDTLPSSEPKENHDHPDIHFLLTLIKGMDLPAA